MKRNGVARSPGPTLLIFTFRFECVFSGPKVTGTFEKRAPEHSKAINEDHDKTRK